MRRFTWDQAFGWLGLALLACPLASDFALGRTERAGLTVRGD